MDLVIRPLTIEHWPGLGDLFGEHGASGGCWCMYFRIGSAYRKRPGEANWEAFRGVVQDGPPPGLLAFAGDVPVGWAQLTPRDALPWLDRNWRLRRVDDVAVWSLSCFYIRKGYRRRGVTAALTVAALDAAKRAGVPALEAYPLDGALSPSSTGTGYASTLARLGFEVVARHFPPRPIMRYDLAKLAVAELPGSAPQPAGEIHPCLSYKTSDLEGRIGLAAVQDDVAGCVA